jgi:hypothetical protein
MKSILRIAAASLTLAAMAAVSTPVFASQDRVELRFGNGYNQQQESYVQPGVIYEPCRYTQLRNLLHAVPVMSVLRSSLGPSPARLS